MGASPRLRPSAARPEPKRPRLRPAAGQRLTPSTLPATASNKSKQSDDHSEPDSKSKDRVRASALPSTRWQDIAPTCSEFLQLTH